MKGEAMTEGTDTTSGSVARNWGRWGEKDERGSLNGLDEETALAGVRAATTGRVFQLGLPIQRAGIPHVEYRGTPQRLTLTSYTDHVLQDFGAPEGIGANEDMLIFASHTSTHIDALCHVHNDGVMFNGFEAEEMKTFDGSQRMGIEKAGAFATRGVLIDVAGHKGVDWLEPGYAITIDDLGATLEAQGVEVTAGCAVLIRTGWLERFYAEGEVMSLEQPGLGLDAARWLADRDVVTIGADNSSVEAMPWDQDRFLGVHIELLVNRGIHMIENLQLADIARASCHEFLLCVAPLLITGATGCPVNPVAIG
jgi:kynurenine formamidase